MKCPLSGQTVHCRLFHLSGSFPGTLYSNLDFTSCWERLRAGGEVGNRGWDGWMESLIQRTWVWANSGRQWRTGKRCAAVHGVTKSWTQLSDWTKISPHLRQLHYIKQWYIKLVLDCHGICCCLCTITNNTSPHFTLKTALVWKVKYMVTLTLYRASLVAQTVKHFSICLHCRQPGFDPWVRKIPWRRKW